jgi:hypothetical protein
MAPLPDAGLRLNWDTFLKVAPFPVRRTVTGLPPPVLIAGSTRATLLVTGSITRFVRIALPWKPTKGLTTTVVKVWQIKKPGNQKPNQTTGNGTQS